MKYRFWSRWLLAPIKRIMRVNVPFKMKTIIRNIILVLNLFNKRAIVSQRNTRDISFMKSFSLSFDHIYRLSRAPAAPVLTLRVHTIYTYMYYELFIVDADCCPCPIYSIHILTT